MKYFPAFLFLLFVLCLAVPQAEAQLADEANTLRLAQTYEKSGRYEDALRYYQDLHRMNPANSNYFDGVRRNLTALKRYDEVAPLLSRRIEEYPRDFSLLVHRGGLHVLLGNTDSATVDWEEAIALNEKNAQVYSLIADHCINAREYDLALRYLRQGRKALNSAQMFTFEIARASVMKQDFDGAMDEYIGYLRAMPQALYQIQQQLSMFSDIPEALDAAVRRAERHVRDNRDNEPLHYLLAWLYMERKDYAAAYDVYHALDRIKKAQGMELVKFANRAYQDGAYAVAAKAYGTAVEEHPDAQFRPQAEFHRARSLEELHEEQSLPGALQPAGDVTKHTSSEAVRSYEGAIRLYEDIAKRYPDLPEGSESLYRIAYLKFHRFGDINGALSILREIADTRREVHGAADADVLIGDILLARGDLDAAIAQYDKVVPSSRLEEDARRELRYKIAEAYFFKGELDTVLVQLDPLSQDVTYDIANDALELASLIIQYRVPGEVPLQQYAQVLFLERQGKLPEAAALAQDIISRFATSDIVDLAYLRTADLQRRSGRVREAAETYRSFLETREESFLRDRGLFFLARLSEEELDDAEAAMMLYQQMLNEHPFSHYAAQARDRILHLRRGQS
ncbi:MAG: tetratricopeptide repeat protein [Bacteroidetes bacterium]|nr:tetratricopeptide repeat protein [Bacteroidota bacterium]